MHWLPKTKIGTAALYAGIAGLMLMFVQYWIAMLFEISVFFPGVIVMACMIGAGIMSIIAFVKHHDRAYLLLLPAIIGLFGLFFILGELLLPH